MTRLREMLHSDLDAVLDIESAVHAYPWTRGNFSDALDGDCTCMVYTFEDGLFGYAVLLPVLDEVQLLDIGIAAQYQRKGLGRLLLGELMAWARSQNIHRMLLEVRPTNVAALALYRSAGFNQIGLRRDYYAAPQGREDAIVMECVL